MKLGVSVLLACIVCPFPALSAPKGKSFDGPAIVGYVFPKGGALAPGQIDAQNLDRINYAFASTKGGRLVAGSATDEQNLAMLVALKQQNPSLTILISVGGWLGSGDFSDIALTDESRKIFADSVVEYLVRDHLDGLDLDWEYPGQPGAGHTYRSEDKENFTLLLRDLRTRFNEEEKTSGKHLYLTIAAGATDQYLAHTEMNQVQQYLDAVNLMAYDYSVSPTGGLTAHNAPLFADPAAPDSNSADASVHAFERAGVPPEKIILGVPFYGLSWQQVGSQNHGLFQAGKQAASGFVPFNTIDPSMIGHGFTRYWDAQASASYLYSEEQKEFVSYEDTDSIAAKCSYVLAQRLGGVMFWEYSDDASGMLLGAIARGLHPSAATRH